VRQTDAGVAGCSFDNGAAGSQQAYLFSILDDVEGCAVLDATAGILEFGFSQDIAAGFPGEVVETDEGRVSNG
jgi:hypothetical protein